MSFFQLPPWLHPAPDSATADTLRMGKSPWLVAIHLLWSVWVLITPMFSGGRYDARWAILTLASYPIFLLLFAMTQLAPRRTSWRYAIGMFVMSLALLAWYPASISYFIYSCVMMRPTRMRLVNYLLSIAGLNAAFVTLGWWLGLPSQFLLIIAVTTFIIGLVVNVETLTQEKDAALRLSQDEVRRIASTAERERIGRDLHDLLGHTLSLITLKLELSRKLIDRDINAARREMEETEKVARHALSEVRSAVSGIRATDLAAELAAARLMLESSRVHLEVVEPVPELAEDTERGLALILREAVTNIARHAHATAVRMTVLRGTDHVLMAIVDDGCGGVHHDGNGLVGMRERARAMGGTLSIVSAKGHGTTISVRIPFAPATKSAVAPAIVEPPSESKWSPTFVGVTTK